MAFLDWYIFFNVQTESTLMMNMLSPDDCKHGVKILALSTVQSYLDEMLNDLHPLQLVYLPQNLRCYPKRLLVDDFLERLQVGTAGFWFELEQVIDVLGGLDVSEKLEVAHGELRGHLHGAELQQRDLALPQQLLCVLVRAKGFRLHVVFQVVPVTDKESRASAAISRHSWKNGAVYRTAVRMCRWMMWRLCLADGGGSGSSDTRPQNATQKPLIEANTSHGTAFASPAICFLLLFPSF